MLFKLVINVFAGYIILITYVINLFEYGECYDPFSMSALPWHCCL